MGSAEDNNDWLDSRLERSGLMRRVEIEGTMRYLKSYAPEAMVLTVFNALLAANHMEETGS